MSFILSGQRWGLWTPLAPLSASVPWIVATDTYSVNDNIAPAVPVPARAAGDRVVILIVEDNSVTPFYDPPDLDGKSWTQVMAGTARFSSVAVQAWEVLNVSAGAATTFEWDWASNSQVVFHTLVIRDSATDQASEDVAGRSSTGTTITFDTVSPSWGTNRPWLACAWAGLDDAQNNGVSAGPSNADATTTVRPVVSTSWSMGALATTDIESSASFSFNDLTSSDSEEWASQVLAIPGGA